jgi:hypothetical protein
MGAFHATALKRLLRHPEPLVPLSIIGHLDQTVKNYSLDH